MKLYAMQAEIWTKHANYQLRVCWESEETMTFIPKENHAFHGCGSMKGNSFLGQTGESGTESEIIILCTFCIQDQGRIGHIHTLFLFQDPS